MKLKRLLCTLLALILCLSFLPISVLAKQRPVDWFGYKYDYYIPVDGTEGAAAQKNDTYPNGTKTLGVIYGWGLIGENGASHEMSEGDKVGQNTDKTYHIELDSETPGDAEFDLVVDCDDETGTKPTPFVNTMPGLSAQSKMENAINLSENSGCKYHVTLDDGTAQARFVRIGKHGSCS